MNRFATLSTLALLAIFGLSQILFVVDEREIAVVRQLGEVVRTVDQPGLSAKLPFIQSVDRFSKQLLTIDEPESERMITKDNEPLLVDYFVKWRITDARLYRQAVGTDERQAQIRLSQVITATIREEFGKRTLQEVVTTDRDRVMNIVRERVQPDAAKIGVNVVDVRLKRVDLDERVTNAVFDRMRSERQRVAAELRSTGAAESERIKAEADKQAQVILAEAYKKAQEQKGQGDAKATAIYASAYGINPEFYAFYRSLEAYKASFANKSDVLVLDPNSEFFRFLRQGARDGRAR
ncbi:MAG: protease modulator HflC [Casimicrobiaceae bacterium]|nr:protease modulator HflC [Casimicrobiaceae bacterium]MDW8312396.1 protease modulator HflC [Burkholderiales bacterium]